jgi:hypothetical protein
MDEAEPWSTRYVIWSSVNWLTFLGTVAFLTWGSGPAGLGLIAVSAIIVLASASVAGQFIAAYRLVAAQDEFVRAITVKRGIAAAGATITAAVFWGLAQQFLAAPQVPAWVVYPLFWGMFGMVSPFIRTSRA